MTTPRFESREEYEQWRRRKAAAVEVARDLDGRQGSKSRVRLILPTLTGLVILGGLLSAIVSTLFECDRERESMRTLVGMSGGLADGIEFSRAAPSPNSAAIVSQLRGLRRNFADLSVSECLRPVRDSLVAAVDRTSQNVMEAESRLARLAADGEADDFLQFLASTAKINGASTLVANKGTFEQCESAVCPRWLNWLHR
jgi:hypothetical protein